MEEKEGEILKEILKLAEKLGDKVTITQEIDALKITVEGDWTNGHPTKRPGK